MRRQSTDSRRDALNLSRSVFLLASPKYSSECLAARAWRQVCGSDFTSAARPGTDRRCSVTRASDPSGAIKFSLRTGCDQLPSRESGAGKPGSGLGSFFEVPGTTRRHVSIGHLAEIACADCTAHLVCPRCRDCPACRSAPQSWMKALSQRPARSKGGDCAGSCQEESQPQAG